MIPSKVTSKYLANINRSTVPGNLYFVDGVFFLFYVTDACSIYSIQSQGTKFFPTKLTKKFNAEKINNKFKASIPRVPNSETNKEKYQTLIN